MIKKIDIELAEELDLMYMARYLKIKIIVKEIGEKLEHRNNSLFWAIRHIKQEHYELTEGQR